MSNQNAARVGKLLGASHVLVGSLSSLASQLLVSVRIVHSETGVIQSSITMEVPRNDLVSFNKDVVVVKSKEGAVFRSALFPGWGQLYNGDQALGWTLLGAALTTLGTAGFYAYSGQQAQSSYEKDLPNTVGDLNVANGHYRRTNQLLLGYAGIWAFAVIDALISGRSSQNFDLQDWVAPPTGQTYQMTP